MARLTTWLLRGIAVAVMWALALFVAYFGALFVGSENICDTSCGNETVNDIIGVVLLMLALAALVGAIFVARKID